MSYSLIGVNRNVWRRALLFDRCRIVFPRSGDALSRSTHNNLYQMVKKRTLEARTKSQSNQFASNDPCTIQTSQHSSSSKIPNVASAIKNCQDDIMKTCDNTELLRATQFSCNQGTKKTCYPAESEERGDFIQDHIPARSRSLARDNETSCKKTEPIDTCKPKKTTENICAVKRNPCSGPPPCPPDYLKLLGALLAGLGLGGFLFWLFSGSGDGDKDDGKEATLKSTDLPQHVPYLLIGGGSASFSAFRSIKANNPTAKILMITNECRKPYMRPPLSKELWYTAQSGGISKDYRFKQWTGSERSLYFEPDEFFISPKKLLDSPNGGLAVAEGFTVKKIDPQKKIAVLADGYEIGYDECLIATGCTPKNLHVFHDAPPGVRDKVMVYRTPDDFDRLKRYADEKKSIAIIGNGFIGSELACSLAKYSKDKGVRVYQIFQESGNMSKVIPDYLSCWTTKKIEELGVCVLPNNKITKAERDEGQLKLHLNNGNTILTDVVVVCVGCDPNTSLAKTSCLEVDSTLGGFLVNAELEARTHLFVAGDASCFYDPLLGRRRVEHHDHSIVSGRLAGENMVGMKKPYAHQSMFWSDLGPDIGYEGIGLVDSSLPTVGVFALPSVPQRSGDNLDENKVAVAALQTEPEKNECSEGTKSAVEKIPCPETDDYGRGVIFYLQNDIVVGILLWNLFNRIGIARTIINQNKKYDDLNEVAKLFDIHS